MNEFAPRNDDTFEEVRGLESRVWQEHKWKTLVQFG
jgi:hypothetical protein